MVENQPKTPRSAREQSKKSILFLHPKKLWDKVLRGIKNRELTERVTFVFIVSWTTIEVKHESIPKARDAKESGQPKRLSSFNQEYGRITQKKYRKSAVLVRLRIK